VTALLFVHGGGDDAYRHDKDIVDRLQPLLGAGMRIDFPRIVGLEGLDWDAVAHDLGNTLRDLPQGSVVIAHSVGASAVVKLLVEGARPRLAHLFLLAPPYNGTDSEWGDTDFAFPADLAAHLPRGLPITLYHSDDDEIISASNAKRYAAKIPEAETVIRHGGGHQFRGDLHFLAEAIMGVA